MWKRLAAYAWRKLLCVAGLPSPCRYIGHRLSFALETGYLLIDHVGDSKTTLLSDSWQHERHDKNRRYNLFKDLSRIMLSLSRVPLPRIGSFTIDNNGLLSLTNRPLTLRLQNLENEGIPTNIERSDTYTAVEPYLLDLLSYHDSRLRHQPNAINDSLDGRQQMAAIACMRSILPHFISRRFRNGPFFLHLTDLHDSNMFVDDAWHIKFLIDLEWTCSLPMEMLQPPYWLTGRGVDQLTEYHLNEFNKMREEFMSVFQAEERLLNPDQQASPLADAMQHGWDVKGFFYFHALESTTGLVNIFHQHLRPIFGPLHVGLDSFQAMFSLYWNRGADQILATKLQHKVEYDAQLQDLFRSKGR